MNAFLGSLVPHSEAVQSCYVGNNYLGISIKSCGGTYTHCEVIILINLFIYKMVIIFELLKQKELISLAGVESINKDCVNNCVESSTSVSGAKYIVKCCTTDNCNFSSNLKSNKIFVFFIGIITAKLFI